MNYQDIRNIKSGNADADLTQPYMHILLRKLEQIRDDKTDYDKVTITRDANEFITSIVEKHKKTGKIRTTTFTRNSNNNIIDIDVTYSMG